jgi:uncharacterized protein (DUF952 family)
MFAKLRSRGVACVLLVLSIVWTAVAICPLLYSLLFPTQDIQRIVRALEGSETLGEDLAPLTQQVTNSAGRLRRAIQVGAFWRISGDYNIKTSHSSKSAQLSYLAWFEKRSNPIILIVTRTDVDGSRLRYEINEGDPLRTLRFYLLPVAALVFSVFWFRSRRAFFRKESTA